MGMLAKQLVDEVGGYERNKVTVQIGKEEITIYAKPLTGADLDALMRRHPKFAEAPTLSATCDLLIAKCETLDGDKLFDAGDKPLLLRMDLGKINRIRRELFPDQDVDLTDAAVDEEMGN